MWIERRGKLGCRDCRGQIRLGWEKQVTGHDGSAMWKWGVKSDLKGDPFLWGWMFGLFLLLGIVNNTAISRGVKVFLWDPVFSSFGYSYTRKWDLSLYLINHKAVLVLIFWGISILSSIVAAFHIPAAVCKGSISPHLCQHLSLLFW